MVGAVIASHGGLADALIKSAGMLVGEAEQVAAAGILPGEAPQEFEERLRAAIKRVDAGDGVIALADLYGGTPNNILYRLAHEETNIRVITGANLPMLLYLFTERQPGTKLEELAGALLAAGRDGIAEFGK